MPDDDKKSDEPSLTRDGEQATEPDASEAEIHVDAFRPEAIAARIDKIGEETDLDRIANEEERKLAARKKEQASKGRRGLEAAASKRLAKIAEATVKRPSALGSVSMEADPLLERAAQMGQWIREHRQVFGGLLAVAVLGTGGAIGWAYRQNKQEADASAILAQAFADEHGHVSAKDSDEEDEAKAKPLYPGFKSTAERRDAALSKYRQVESKYPGTGSAILARLAEGGLLLDAGDAAAALAAYDDVRASPLARADAEVKGRSVEGIGFARELLAQRDGGNREKHLDEALAAFRDLEHVDAKGFKELAMYHQARVLQDKGDNANATALLKDVEKRVTDPGESHPFSYLAPVVEDRLRELDPTALPPKPAKMKGGGGMGGPGGADMSDPQIQELIRQLKEQQKGKGPPPALPGAPQ